MSQTFVLTIEIRHDAEQLSSHCKARVYSVHYSPSGPDTQQMWQAEKEYLWDESHRPSIGSFTRSAIDAFYAGCHIL